MKRKKIILTFLWLAPLIFALITLASYDKDIDDIRLGFPETFYSKNHGMNLNTGQMGEAVSFRTDEFLRNVGFALLVTLVLLICYALFKKKNTNRYNNEKKWL